MSSDSLSQALSQLPALIEPTPIGLWPLAPGWYLLIIIVAGLGSMTIWLYLRYHRETRLLRLVSTRIEALSRNVSNIESESVQRACREAAIELSSLLRIVGRDSLGSHALATASGERWITAMNRIARTRTPLFDESDNRLFEAIYRDTPIEQTELMDLLAKSRRWIRALQKSYNIATGKLEAASDTVDHGGIDAKR